jgi:DNA repair protein RadC
MLSAVLKSRTAIDISIKIMNAFIEMRKLIQSNSNLLIKVDKLESNQSGMSLKLIETDKRVDKIFSLMESGEIKPKQGILFDKQVFDAYKYVSDIVIDEKVMSRGGYVGI